MDRYFSAPTNGNQAGLGASIPTSNAASTVAVVQSNTTQGAFSFANGSAQSIQFHLPIPSVVPTTLSWDIRWWSDDNGAHNVTWNVNVACSPTSSNPSLSTSAGTATTSVPGSADATVTSTITWTVSGCSAGDELYGEVKRRGDTDSATSAALSNGVRVHN